VLLARGGRELRHALGPRGGRAAAISHVLAHVAQLDATLLARHGHPLQSVELFHVVSIGTRAKEVVRSSDEEAIIRADDLDGSLPT
jgi:hypothetical protein